MAKIRGIKPEFWTDGDIVECSIPARLFFIGLWNFADDAGGFVWNPRELKMKIFPSENCIEVDDLLKDLEENELIKKFEYEKITYGVVINFLKHQRPHKRYLKYILPHKYLINFLPKEYLEIYLEKTGGQQVDTCDQPNEGEVENDNDSDNETEKEGEKGLTPAQWNKKFFSDKDFQKEVTKQIAIERKMDLNYALKQIVGPDGFVDYWTEPTKSGHKKKWELEKTFELRRRIGKWFSNSLTWKK